MIKQQLCRYAHECLQAEGMSNVCMCVPCCSIQRSYVCCALISRALRLLACSVACVLAATQGVLALFARKCAWAAVAGIVRLVVIVLAPNHRSGNNIARLLEQWRHLCMIVRNEGTRFSSCGAMGGCQLLYGHVPGFVQVTKCPPATPCCICHGTSDFAFVHVAHTVSRQQ